MLWIVGGAAIYGVAMGLIGLALVLTIGRPLLAKGPTRSVPERRPAGERPRTA